jgi:hypothetical protein
MGGRPLGRRLHRFYPVSFLGVGAAGGQLLRTESKFVRRLASGSSRARKERTPHAHWFTRWASVVRGRGPEPVQRPGVPALEWGRGRRSRLDAGDHVLRPHDQSPGRCLAGGSSNSPWETGERARWLTGPPCSRVPPRQAAASSGFVYRSEGPLLPRFTAGHAVDARCRTRAMGSRGCWASLVNHPASAPSESAAVSRTPATGASPPRWRRPTPGCWRHPPRLGRAGSVRTSSVPPPPASDRSGNLPDCLPSPNDDARLGRWTARARQ